MPLTTEPAAWPDTEPADPLTLPAGDPMSVFAAVRALILDGVLTPGERLPVRMLADLLGVAPMRILTVLPRPRDTGLIEPHRWGYRVIAPGPETALHARGVLTWMVHALTTDRARRDEVLDLVNGLLPWHRDSVNAAVDALTELADGSADRVVAGLLLRGLDGLVFTAQFTTEITPADVRDGAVR